MKSYQETSKRRRLWPTLGLKKHGKEGWSPVGVVKVEEGPLFGSYSHGGKPKIKYQLWEKDGET